MRNIRMRMNDMIYIQVCTCASTTANRYVRVDVCATRWHVLVFDDNLLVFDDSHPPIVHLIINVCVRRCVGDMLARADL